MSDGTLAQFVGEVGTRYLFFTGKGGVSKTSTSCAIAVALADRGRRVLLVSTDPASNLDEVLGATVGSSATAVPGVAGLSALNVDPEWADSAITRIEEQLSGACTVEIAAFDEFTALLGDDDVADSSGTATPPLWPTSATPPRPPWSWSPAPRPRPSPRRNGPARSCGRSTSPGNTSS